MKLYSTMFSTDCRKVGAVLVHTGCENVEVVDMDKPNRHRSSEYLAINPMGSVPSLVDHDLVLWGSNSICCHLAATSGSSLWPNDTALRSDILRWMFWESTFWSEPLFRAVRQSQMSADVDPKIKDSIESRVVRSASVLDAHLSKREYLVGNELTLADFVVGVWSSEFEFLESSLPKFNFLRDWGRRMLSLPALSDPFRMARTDTRLETFAGMYDGDPKWEVEGPQPEVVRLLESGRIKGRVLDVGCGSGENAIYLASKGFSVCGLDFVPKAIEKARRKSQEGDASVEFIVADALEPVAIGTFDTVLDVGLFHSLSDSQQIRYVSNLRRLLHAGGVMHLMAFSDAEYRSGGPRRTGKSDIERIFSTGWTIRSVQEGRLSLPMFSGGAKAWIAEIEAA